MRQIVFVLFSILCYTLPVASDPSTSHIPKTPVTELELQILEYGDYYSSDKVLSRLQILFKEQGPKSIYSAIPVMNELLAKLQTSENTRYSELENELVSFLGKIGDIRSMPVLLKAIKRNQGNVSIGLAKMPSAVDSVVIHIQDERLQVRNKAIHCLIRMYKADPSIFTIAHENLIRDQLVENLKQHEYKSMDCFALAFFGDSSTIPILTEIAETDTLTGLTRKYPNRYYAKFAISKIKE